MARYLVEAHVLEGRSVGELAAAHGVHRSWIYKLLARYRAGGYEALAPRSRRPRSCKHETPVQVIEAIVQLRRQLQADGHDAGAATIAYHLAKRMGRVPSRATIWRILKREGLIVPEPQKRPRSSLIRFQAQLPNEMWQTDITHWLSWTSSTRQQSCTGCPPACSPTTAPCYLDAQEPAQTLAQLQGQLDRFVHYYNDIRPHRALDGRTPLQAYSTRIKAKPAGQPTKAHFRVRNDKVDAYGKVSIRYMSKLHHIGLGRAHSGRTVKLLIADQSIRVIDQHGQLIRDLTLDPSRDYQPLKRA
jgi:transposase